ncbi:MAG: hypothetical protein FWG33_02295 [Oscillospiraceae bacterium]|nr:hypothetical protein [Oscillospiraceae bacterium]
MKKVFKLAALITMIAMIAATAMLPVMADDGTTEPDSTTGPDGTVDTTDDGGDEGGDNTPITLPTEEDGSVKVGKVTVQFSEDGEFLEIVANTDLPSFVFALDAQTWTGLAGDAKSDLPGAMNTWALLGGVDNPGGIAANVAVTPGTVCVYWPVAEGVEEVKFSGNFILEENEGDPQMEVNFTVIGGGGGGTTPAATPGVPGRRPGPNSNYETGPAATTGAPAAGGVPRGGVVLAIVPTLMAAGAAVVASRKRK